MKVKPVTVNDQEYKISPLSVGQVDEIIFAGVEANPGDKEISAVVQGSKRFIRARVCPVIAASLNNVVAGNGNWFADADPWKVPEGKDVSAWWTPERVFGELLYEETMKLYNEIAALSGLRSNVEVAKTNRPKLGEEEAVSAVH
jgi:hypothetical protein